MLTPEMRRRAQPSRDDAGSYFDDRDDAGSYFDDLDAYAPAGLRAEPVTLAELRRKRAEAAAKEQSA
jgi:hypothetical protein